VESNGVTIVIPEKKFFGWRMGGEIKKKPKDEEEEEKKKRPLPGVSIR
jgi:hypothetical protein